MLALDSSLSYGFCECYRCLFAHLDQCYAHQTSHLGVLVVDEALDQWFDGRRVLGFSQPPNGATANVLAVAGKRFDKRRHRIWSANPAQFERNERTTPVHRRSEHICKERNAAFVPEFAQKLGRVLALWIPFLLVAIPTAYLWYRDRRRLPSGHCRKCGYNLTGNVSGVCPECGCATKA